LVSLWDWTARKRLNQLPAFATAVSSLAFSRDGALLAVAVSYMHDDSGAAGAGGPGAPHPPDAIVVRAVAEIDVRPKAPPAARA
jgi:hypothetical protein